MCLLCMECGLPLLLWLHYGCCLNHHCCVSHMCVCVCVCVVGVKLFNFYKLYATTMRTQMATGRQTFLSYKLLFIWYFCFFYYFNFLFSVSRTSLYYLIFVFLILGIDPTHWPFDCLCLFSLHILVAVIYLLNTSNCAFVVLLLAAVLAGRNSMEPKWYRRSPLSHMYRYIGTYKYILSNMYMYIRVCQILSNLRLKLNLYTGFKIFFLYFERLYHTKILNRYLK